ncbi:hypothetical protein H1R20_g2478, partial [Candolleomyces eurysporus]
MCSLSNRLSCSLSIRPSPPALVLALKHPTTPSYRSKSIAKVQIDIQNEFLPPPESTDIRNNHVPAHKQHRKPSENALEKPSRPIWEFGFEGGNLAGPARPRQNWPEILKFLASSDEASQFRAGSDRFLIGFSLGLDLQIVMKLARDLLVSVQNDYIGGLFRMRWPLDENGNMVPPDRVWRFLDLHNVTWGCFCIQNGILHLARFVTKPDGTVMVYCGYRRSRCPFKVNLTRIYQTTKLRGDKYDSYPTSRLRARGPYEDAISKVVEIEDESSDEDDVGGEADVGSDGAADGSRGEDGGPGDDGYHHDHDDDYGCYDCRGEPKPNPRTFVVPILDGWLGHYPRHLGQRTLVGEWVPGQYGWPVGENE